MDLRDLLRRQRYTSRIVYRLEELEAAVGPDDGYAPVRAAFDGAFHRYTRARGAHLLLALVFYGSLIGSVTARFGLRIDIFDRISAVLGLGTVFLLYCLSRHRLKLLYADLEHAQAHAIGYLSAVEAQDDDGN